MLLDILFGQTFMEWLFYKSDQYLPPSQKLGQLSEPLVFHDSLSWEWLLFKLLCFAELQTPSTNFGLFSTAGGNIDFSILCFSFRSGLKTRIARQVEKKWLLLRVRASNPLTSGFIVRTQINAPCLALRFTEKSIQREAQTHGAM